MAYIDPSEFSTKLVDSGEQKVYMSTKDTIIRAYMAGAILAFAAVFADPTCASALLHIRAPMQWTHRA